MERPIALKLGDCAALMEGAGMNEDEAIRKSLERQAVKRFWEAIGMDGRAIGVAVRHLREE